MIIKDLMNEPVTSVSRQDQKMSQMAAVVFVMGQEGIRHSEATTIPGLLRIVPGLDAAQINSNARADSAREFDSQSANKRLVLA